MNYITNLSPNSLQQLEPTILPRCFLSSRFRYRQGTVALHLFCWRQQIRVYKTWSCLRCTSWGHPYCYIQKKYFNSIRCLKHTVL